MRGVTGSSRFWIHRPVDLALVVVGGVAMLPVMAVAQCVCAGATKSSGLFRQLRVGRHGELFSIVKLRTMPAQATGGSSTTTSTDARVTASGHRIRRLKLDELPQIFNVLKGEMGLIGPRPDVPGFADQLVGHDREVLSVRPGLSGPATVLLRDEEAILGRCDEPDAVNKDVLFPLKVRVNLAWIESGSLLDDLRLLVWTVKPPPLAALVELFDGWDPSLTNSASFQHYLELQTGVPSSG